MPYRWTLTDLSSPYLGSEVLTKDPIGWDEGTYTIKRSDVYKGAFHEYTTSLKFHCNGGGKEFIDLVYATNDIDGRVDVLVEYDCDGSGTYDALFNGIINLASYKTDGEYTTVSIEKSDLLTKLFNRDEISVDLETTTSIGGSTITAPNSITLPMPTMDIKYYDEWNIGDGYSYNVDGSVNIGEVLVSYTSHNAGILSSDIDTAQAWSENTDFSTTVFERNSIEPIITFNETGINYPISVNWDIDFDWTFTDTLTGGSSRTNIQYSLILAWGKKNESVPGSLQSQILYDSSGYSTTPFVESHHLIDNGTITINAGDSIWLAWFVEDDDYDSFSVNLKWDYLTSSFRINTTTQYLATTCKSMLIHEAFNQVVDAIVDSDNNFYSDFYGRTDSEKITYLENGCASKIAVTNGLNIREFTDKKIFATFKDLFESLDCLHNIGMGIVSGLVRVEPLSYWFDSTTKIITLPLVNKYEIKNDNRRYINKVDIGYQKWESEFHGGLDDPNTKHEYSTIVSSVKTLYQKLCKYITSPYTIEFTRRKNKTILATEDWRYDNDNFLIAAKKYYRGKLSFLVNAGDDSIVITGAELNEITVGDTILIGGTVSNNGYYTVTYALTQNNQGASPVTTLRVAESVTNELLVTGTIEGITNPFYCPEQYIDSFSYGAGMTSLTTGYNLRLTPARMLLAHMNVITAGLRLINGAIKFIKGDGNTNLECSATVVVYTDGCPEEYKSQQLKENQSFQWNDSNVLNISPIWGTETYSFEYPLSYSDFKTIKANPYGYIEFYKFTGQPMYGYIINMEYKMKTGLTKFELLKAII